MSIENIARSVEWKKVDFLLCTPSQLQSVFDVKGLGYGLKINPRWIVIEDYELMFENKAEIETIRRILREYLGTVKSARKEQNKLRKFVLTSKLQTPKVPQSVQSWFPDLHSISASSPIDLMNRFSFSQTGGTFHSISQSKKRTLMIVPPSFNLIPVGSLKYLDKENINEKV